MQKLICHCCGASNSPNPSVSHVSCEYCSAAISVTAFYKDLSTSSLESLREAGMSEEESKQVSRLIQAAEEFLSVDDISRAKVSYEEVLKLYPSHLPSRMNLARCILLDREINMIARCESATKYVGMIAEHQKDPEILALIDGLAFDMASFAKEQVNGLDALSIFQMSKRCSLHMLERDTIVSDFIKPLKEKAIQKIRKGIKKDKRKYSPSATEIELLLQYADFDEESRGWCLTLANWLEVNSSKIHARSAEKIPALRNVSKGYAGEYVQFSMGVFGVSEKIVT